MADVVEVPTGPLQGLTQLNSANLASWNSPARFTYPVGNSWASPVIAPTDISRAMTGLPTAYDHSFLLNSLLYDRFYFSGLANRQGNFVTSATLSNLAKAFVNEEQGVASVDKRMVPYFPDGETREDAIAALSVPSSNDAEAPQVRGVAPRDLEQRGEPDPRERREQRPHRAGPACEPAEHDERHHHRQLP